MAEIEEGSSPVQDDNGNLNLKALTDRLRWVKENTEEMTGEFSTMECGTGPGFDIVILAGKSRYVLASFGGQSLSIMERGQQVQKSLYCGPQSGEVTAQYIPSGEAPASTEVRGTLLSLDFK